MFCYIFLADFSFNHFFHFAVASAVIALRCLLIVAAVAVVAGLATLIVLQLISSSVDIDTLCADAAAFLFLALFSALIFAFLLRARRLIKR